MTLGCRVQGLGFRVWGFVSLGFGFIIEFMLKCRIQGFDCLVLGFWFSGFGFEVSVVGSRLTGLAFGFRVPGSGFQVSCFVSRVSGFVSRVSHSEFQGQTLMALLSPLMAPITDGNAPVSTAVERIWHT